MDYKLFKELNKQYNIKKGSKLSLSIDNNCNLIFEFKELNKVSSLLFVYIMLEKLIESKVIDKQMFLDMVNEIL